MTVALKSVLLLTLSIISTNCHDGDFSSVDLLINDVKEENIQTRQGTSTTKKPFPARPQPSGNWTLPPMFATTPKPVTMYPPIDGKDCDSKSIGFVVKSADEVPEKRKVFKNCTFSRGEFVTISNLANERHILTVICTSTFPINDTVTSPPFRYKETFVLDTYIDPRNDIEPHWICIIRRPNVDRSEIKLDAYEGFRLKNSFEYDVTTVGLFDVNPVLVSKWKPKYNNDQSSSDDSD